MRPVEGNNGYRCPKCGSVCSVKDSRPTPTGTVRRRRRCANPECEHRFSTEEVPDTDYDGVLALRARLLKQLDAITKTIAIIREELG